jgi:hypothetical protein
VTTSLHTPNEAAARLRCSRKTLNAHVRSGALRYVLIGRGTKRPRRMFTDADLDEFIERQRRMAVPCPSIAQKARRLAVLLEPKQRRSTTAKKGPTDCRGRPLVEVSGPSFRRTAKARSLPGQLSIGPFQQSRFSTAKVPTVEHKKNKGFLSRYTTRQLSVRKCFSGRLPIQHSIFRVLWRSPRLNCPMLDARRTRLNGATRDHL